MHSLTAPACMEENQLKAHVGGLAHIGGLLFRSALKADEGMDEEGDELPFSHQSTEQLREQMEDELREQMASCDDDLSFASERRGNASDDQALTLANVLEPAGDDSMQASSPLNSETHAMVSAALPGPQVLWMPVLAPIARSAGHQDVQTPPAQKAREELQPSGRSAARMRQLGQMLRKEKSMTSGCYRVAWCVDARKLKGNVKIVTSPILEVPFDSSNPALAFKIMVCPRDSATGNSGMTFEKSKGCGFLQLKCDSTMCPEITRVGFRFSVGKGEKNVTRGPVWHDFSESAVAVLPKGQDEWDFFSATHRKTETFSITLEIIPGSDVPCGSSLGGA